MEALHTPPAVVVAVEERGAHTSVLLVRYRRGGTGPVGMRIPSAKRNE